jgi:hypothetical protein
VAGWRIRRRWCLVDNGGDEGGRITSTQSINKGGYMDSNSIKDILDRTIICCIFTILLIRK